MESIKRGSVVKYPIPGDNREFTRIESNAVCTLFDGNDEYDCKVLNISETGFCVEFKGNFKIKRLCIVKFSFCDENDEIFDGRVIIRWISPSENGFVCGCELKCENYDYYYYVTRKKAESGHYRYI